ncbi:MAG: hypothetical protein K2X57_04360 [Xanthobacteraceae bacterium]|nr:hypothetical protein [Xanthobacteraceae bacterium]
MISIIAALPSDAGQGGLEERAVNYANNVHHDRTRYPIGGNQSIDVFLPDFIG